MDTLTTDQLRSALADLDGWEPTTSDDASAIRRELRFDGFRDAIDFIVRVADLAEEADHHPEISNVYDRVTLVLSTHSAGGVTQKDLDLAAAIDRLTSAQ
jgi:4a-hydroxytetrahydrobiopterin dehydratase